MTARLPTVNDAPLSVFNFRHRSVCDIPVLCATRVGLLPEVRMAAATISATLRLYSVLSIWLVSHTIWLVTSPQNTPLLGVCRCGEYPKNVQVVVFSYQRCTLGTVIQRHPINAAVAAELSGYLRAASQTQAQLAAATDMNEVVVQRYLAGTRDINVSHIAKFAHVLNFEPAELMRRAMTRLAKSQTELETE